MTLRVAPFEGEPAEWNALVERVPSATHCHRYQWLGVIGEAFGHRTFAWGARDASGALVGVLPLVRVRTPLFGHYLVSMPFLNAGGPLGSPEVVTALAAE
ncbi:MAG: FemAB family XrtA/PEP-CTERM system-associated protein, partial [Candidatus Rokuibacteriota bacterium]